MRPITFDSRRRAFVETARLAMQEVAETGLVYEAEEVFSYLQNMLSGKHAERPKAVKINAFRSKTE